MSQAVLLIGDGPFAVALAKNFEKKQFSIIMTTIYENKVSEIRESGYIPIFVNALSEEGCKSIYEQCSKMIADYSLEIKYIIHTARRTFYEFSPNDMPDDVKKEMFMVNAESPKLLAEYFYPLGAQFVYTSSCATRGFSRDLSSQTVQDETNPVGTSGVKHYSYTKRLGEEGLYAFFHNKNALSNLTISYISLMLGTNFFKDMGTEAPSEKGWDEKKTADYIVSKLLKGQKRIFPGFQSKLAFILPAGVVSKILGMQPELKPLSEK